MRVKGLTEAQVRRAASSLGFKVYNLRPAGRFLAFVIRPDKPKGERYRARGRSGRRAWAICWHGHRAFMDRLFAANPRAVVASTVARYEGEDDYHRKLALGLPDRAFDSTLRCECKS